MMGPLLAVALLTCLAVDASSAAGDVRGALASTAGSYPVLRDLLEPEQMGRRAGRTKV